MISEVRSPEIHHRRPIVFINLRRRLFQDAYEPAVNVAWSKIKAWLTADFFP